MHRVQALVWTQQSAWQELKQLFSNETNIPWQLMMENTEPNWGNAALCNVEIYLQAVRAPLRKHNFVVNVWKITTSPGFKDELSHTVSSQYLQGKWCFENYSIIVFVCFFEIIDKKKNLVQLKNLRSRPHYLNQKRKKENKDYAIFFVCLTGLFVLPVLRVHSWDWCDKSCLREKQKLKAGTGRTHNGSTDIIRAQYVWAQYKAAGTYRGMETLRDSTANIKKWS